MEKMTAMNVTHTKKLEIKQILKKMTIKEQDASVSSVENAENDQENDLVHQDIPHLHKILCNFSKF